MAFQSINLGGGGRGNRPMMVQVHDTIESIKIARKSYDSIITTMAPATTSLNLNGIDITEANQTPTRQQIQSHITTIGFVPTMGALHEGHLELVRKARVENDIVIVSIFVNPTQFGPNEDLTTYPRDIEHDIDLLEHEGIDHVFIPSNPNIMYGPNHCTYIVAEGFDDTHEGRIRPGHFRGVATIVIKLFNIIRPTIAYFGQKDAIQCILIKRIVSDLNMNDDVSIIICNTTRDVDGVALSSRNAYLTVMERKAAPILYKALCSAKKLYEIEKQNNNKVENAISTMPTMPSSILKADVVRVLETEPLVSEIQYVVLNDIETMKELDDVAVVLQNKSEYNQNVVVSSTTTSTNSSKISESSGAVLSIAVKIGNVRLIDNVILN